VSRPLTLLGTSVRAAAESARRAGFAPRCLDLFADRETRAVDPGAVRLDPENFAAACLERLAAGAIEGPWAFTGGLENEPALLETLEAYHPMFGGPAASVAACRVPGRLAAWCHGTGAVPPELGDPRRARPAAGWIRRRAHSTGGSGIAFWRGEPIDPARGERLERWIPGRPIAGIFVAWRGAGAAHHARLLGITGQRVGEAALGAPPFTAAGAVYPEPVPAPARRALARLGARVARATGLRGPFGIDAILEPRGRLRPLEVNPRYTAGMAAWERATGASVFAIASGGPEAAGALAARQAPRTGTYTQAVLFARRPGFLPPLAAELGACRLTDRPIHPSAPNAPVRLHAGEPVVTLLAEGENEAACRRRYLEAARRIEMMMAPAHGMNPESA